MEFFERVEAACRAKDSLLCVGLDPRVEATGPAEARRLIVEANRRLIEATRPYAAAYKPNIAFYEAWGPEGLGALDETLDLLAGEVVILDAKRGDIGATAEAYAQASFRHAAVGAVTVAPWMGRDSVDPFLTHAGKAAFVLARTSNPSAAEVQDLPFKKGPWYLKMARLAAHWDRRVGLVVAGNDPAALTLLRRALPETWFLAPGIGTQGGTMATAVGAGLRADGLGLLTAVSREIALDADPGRKAEALRREINQARAQVLAARQNVPTVMSKLKRKLLEGLIRTQCFQLGEFTLKSGLKSPFYVDLRRVQSEARVLRLAGKAYAELLSGLEFDRIAAIPVAALTLGAAASLETGAPLVFPRLPPKAHGTGNTIEGAWQAGETVVLLDDLITTGQSKQEALEVLRREGLKVTDLVVLLERGSAGRADMKAAGIELHAFARIEEFFTVARDLGLIDAAQEAELLSFVRISPTK